MTPIRRRSCEEAERLLVAYQRATEVYSAAAGELSHNSGRLLVREYDAFRQIVAKAHRGAEAALLSLNSHIAQHGC